MSTTETDSGPGQREVAHRLFAAEFDDTTLSYSESDEERAPNYVVTPTGARVNRLFVAGVLTEVERVNNETLRGRVVDPTGAFVTYAGQYQPAEQTFLDTASPPAFVALTGKARTFEPEDSDMVYTSVRPESLAEVDAETRDRAIVTAAKSTLDRLAVFSQALTSELRGDALETALAAGGAPKALAAGIPRAIEHYGTTDAYVEGLRQLAVDALEVVTGDREEVRRFDVAVDDSAPTSIGPLPSTDVTIDDQALDSSVDTGTDSEPTGTHTADETDQTDATDTADTADAIDTTDTADAIDTTDTADVADSDASPEFESAAPSEPETSKESAQTADSPASPNSIESADSTEPAMESSEPEAETAASASTSAESVSTNESASAEPIDADSVEPETPETPETHTDSSEADVDAPPAADSVAEQDLDPTDIDGMYEMDDEEREAVESEFGTEFSTGSEVDPAGEADIDVPDADELEPESPAESETAQSGGLGDFQDTIAEDSVTEAEPDASSDLSDTDSDSGADNSETDSDGESADVSADVNLEDAAIELMDELDDGDGVERSTVTAQIAERHGVAQQAVDDAIEEALLSGRCYEPTDGILKSI